jgi:nitrogen fixation-related uncharacterized protein
MDVWIAYAVVGVLVFSAAFVWAVRARQFTEMDRQRHIPLRELGEDEQSAPKAARVDRWTLIGLVITVVGMLAWGIILGARYM